MRLVAVLALAISGCTPPMEKQFVARNERVAQVLVDRGTVQSLSVTRVTQPGERQPVTTEVTVWLLDEGNKQLETRSPTVTVGPTSEVVLELVASSYRPLMLFVDWGPQVGSTELPIMVVDLLETNNDFEVTYVDRVDLCTPTVFRLPSGRTVCPRSDWQVSIYDPDGGLESRFTGIEVSVPGDELWSNTPESAEHRTDTPAGLRLDGFVPYARGSAVGESQPGRALRATTTGFVELTWDGGMLGSSPVEGFPAEPDAAAVFRIGDELAMVSLSERSGRVCTLQRGCLTTVCPPIRTCGQEVLLGVTSRESWGLSSANGLIVAARRPESFDFPLRVAMPESLSAFNRFPENPVSSRPAILSNPLALLPQTDGQSVWLEVWRHPGNVIGVSEDWLVASTSPFTLRFHRLSPPF